MRLHFGLAVRFGLLLALEWVIVIIYQLSTKYQVVDPPFANFDKSDVCIPHRNKALTTPSRFEKNACKNELDVCMHP